MLKKQIPNLFTLLNLLSGLIAILFAVTNQLVEASLFVFLGIFFDFFDGFFARKFKVEGDFGKELDSLADMVTSGVVPGLVMFQLILFSAKEKWLMDLASDVGNWQSYSENYYYFIPLIGLMIPLGAAYRLAKFNIDERQSNSFIGLPTPALSLFVLSIPLILNYSNNQIVIDMLQNKYVLIGITIIGTYMLNVELPLFSLKFKNYSWSDNTIKYIFLIASVFLLIILNMVAIPTIIILYIIFSIIDNIKTKKTRLSNK